MCVFIQHKIINGNIQKCLLSPKETKFFMKKILLLLSFYCAVTTVLAQNNVGIGTSNPLPSAVLDLTATDKGVLTPRMTTLQRLSIAAPANGLLVYDTD